MGTKGPCSIEGCENEAHCRGWCKYHYEKLRFDGAIPIKHRPRRFGDTCNKCGGRGPFRKWATTCNTCRAAQSVEWKKRNPARAKEIDNAAAKRRYASLREGALAAYGYRCTCCGETHPAFLVIDHVRGGGRAHLRSMGKGAGPFIFYRWLRKNQYPPEFQILCHNCNFAKSNGGCPHALHSSQ